ncbi:MAG: CDP-diacylglycerol--serine O-phosphatidyltransferase [Gammaproteobacteria bacterium]|nr:CDP-diacylglycerol--serine O-phosphatidyltransferase [Gammaproteobacteria bacterium]MDH5691695.1 CDP-diacylglycerol--serine O-phosphatidyltransferase [Gammaproteobacteria bacterium]
MDQPEKRQRRRGIYLLPNLFTTGCLFFGFYAIVSAIKGHYDQAAIAVFIAMIMDGLDGRVARLTNTSTEFGVQYDSLADMVSFGVAPALVIYLWTLQGLGKLGWLGAFLCTAGAALRLARFNTQVNVVDKRFFQGLPSPAAAALVAGTVWVGETYQLNSPGVSYFALVITIAAGLLMVSNFRYYSFKDVDLKGKVPFLATLLIVLLFVFISLDPPQVLFFIMLVYASSGPVVTFVMLNRHKAQRRKQEQESEKEHHV